MKFLVALVIAMVVIHMGFCDVMADLKKDFDAAELDLDEKAMEKELHSKDLPAAESNASEDAESQASIESQLKDLLDSMDKDGKKTEKKEASSDQQFHDILEKYEKSDAFDKDKLLSELEKIVQKEVISHDVAEDASGECKDIRRDCLSLARAGYCGTHRNVMRKKCAKTCQFCGVKCENRLADKRCQYFKRVKQCTKQKDRMKKLCFKECGYCAGKIEEIKGCAKSKYGCCWDRTLARTDKAGTNCPPCRDNYKTLCSRFKDFCRAKGDTGDFIRRFCPDKCGICSMKCADDFKSADKCHYWMQIGYCESLKQSMKVLCQKTCDFC